MDDAPDRSMVPADFREDARDLACLPYIDGAVDGLSPGRGDPVQGDAQFTAGNYCPVALLDIPRMEFTLRLLDYCPLDLRFFAQGDEPGGLRRRLRTPAKEDEERPVCRGQGNGCCRGDSPAAASHYNHIPFMDGRGCGGRRRGKLGDFQGGAPIGGKTDLQGAAAEYLVCQNTGHRSRIGELSEVDGLAGNVGPFPAGCFRKTGEPSGEGVNQGSGGVATERAVETGNCGADGAS